MDVSCPYRLPICCVKWRGYCQQPVRHLLHLENHTIAWVRLQSGGDRKALSFAKSSLKVNLAQSPRPVKLSILVMLRDS